MSIDIIYKHFARVLFFMALAALTIAFVEWVGNFIGFTIITGFYTAGRLLELSASLLVFVVVILLRQIRDELRQSDSA